MNYDNIDENETTASAEAEDSREPVEVADSVAYSNDENTDKDSEPEALSDSSGESIDNNQGGADAETDGSSSDDSDGEDDFESTVDLPLPTREELENINDIELPDFSGNTPKRKRSIFRNKVLKGFLIAIGSIAAIFIIVYAACIVTLPTDTISKGVFIENLDVSGLTYDEALKEIEQTYLFENQQISLGCNGQTFTIEGLDINLTAYPEETAQKAIDFGKTGNKLKDGMTAFILLVNKHEIIPVATVDEEKLKEKLNEFGVQIFGEHSNHYVEILDDEKTVVWPGSTGYDGNPDTAAAEVSDAVKNESFTNIHVSLASAPPAELTVEDFDLLVYKDPIDAYYTVEDNKVNIVEETNGRYIDKDEAAQLLANVTEGGGPIEIPYYISYPSITSDMLSSKLFSSTLASYSTSFASSTANRASNVARAASLINGKVLAPGEVFSFNDTVGKRTVANGFSTAPEYVGGKTVEGIGGGTCQVSSTLYNAVLYADLTVVSRTNHMFTVSYVPNGQDATVADNGPDFKFSNNTDYPIKISAYTSGGQITFSLIGTAWEPSREVKINNSTSYSSNGDTIVRTTRTVYVNGEVFETETMPSSTYKKHTEEEQEESSTD
ncbi:MAG: VanW family protein [Oscillospiraceae bacterium]|nr:VanW family protein [Oscillospiraceae bacterium]